MKTVVLPKKSEDTIDVSEINSEYLVIVSENCKIIGFLVYEEDEWGFQPCSKINSGKFWNISILDTIKEVKESYPNCIFYIENY